MNDHTDVFYAKNKTELPWPIRPSMVYDKKKKKNQIRQQHD